MDIGVDFREQPDDGVPHSSLIPVLLDGADNLFVVKTLALRAGYRSAKLPDFGTSLTIESLHTTMLHMSPPPAPAVAEQKESSGLVAMGSCRKTKSAE